MTFLAKSVKIIEPGSALNGKKADILVEGGIIRQIKQNIKPEKGIKIIESKNLHVSAGWFDMQASFCDPGFEHKEDLQSGAKCAIAGGFTGVAIIPSTQPPLHSKSEIEYILNKSSSYALEIFPMGCISHNREGNELAEMFDMHSNGAIAFTDGKRPVMNSGLLLRALMYAKNFNGLIVAYCEDKSVSGEGKMNESETSTRLGLKGIPGIAEEIMVARNIALAEYAETKMHIACISTKKSVDLIRQAKAKRIKITAGVNAHHLVYDDSMLEDFDTNLKVNPPLRSKQDVGALIKAVSEGIIDVITTDHTPENIENKEVEFDHAAFGMTALQTFYPMINSIKGKLRPVDIVHAVAINPRKILGIHVPRVKAGEKANLTFFDPDTMWTYNEKSNFSKSSNSPIYSKELKGKVIAAYNKGKLFIS